MAFTYTSNPASVAIDYVRWHTGETVAAESMVSDEEITSLIALNGSNNAAVIAVIRYKIIRLSQPDFKADWIQVSNSAAVKSLQSMLKDKAKELGVALIVASVTHVYRADSAATAEPDYSEGRP